MLTFDDALSTLMAMFGPQWSKENLDLVLRHFDGHMENVVDTILANGDKRPQDLIEQLNKAQVGFDLDEQLAQELGREEARLQRATGVPPPALRRDPGSDRPRSNGTAMPSESRPKVELPHDFLRIPGYPHSDMSSSTVADDEALARALQNELFMNQIRDDPELSHLSRPRYSSMTNTPGLASRPGNPFAFPNRPTAATGGQDGHGFLDALSGKLLLIASCPWMRNTIHPNFSISFLKLLHTPTCIELGDNAKKKLAILAQKFNASIIKPNLTGGSGGMGGRSGADEGRGLLHRGRDEEELLFSEGDTEMKSMSSYQSHKKGD